MKHDNTTHGFSSPSADGNPPQTLGDALDELAANGLADEVSATRDRVQAHTASFLRVLADK